MLAGVHQKARRRAHSDQSVEPRPFRPKTRAQVAGNDGGDDANDGGHGLRRRGNRRHDSEGEDGREGRVLTGITQGRAAGSGKVGAP